MNKMLLNCTGLFSLLLMTFCIHAQQKPTIEWIEIKAGSFFMGSPTNEIDRHNDEVLHKVILSAFKMSKYEITVGQFKVFIDATGYVTDAEKGTGGLSGSIMVIGDGKGIKAGVNWKYDTKGNQRPVSEFNHPVIHVSWNDAKAFAEWMDCRLPTEAEWEYSCRSGTTTPFYTGNNLTRLQANFDGGYLIENTAKGEHSGTTMPIGSFPPNKWGLYDMHGNVWEWCSDWYGEYGKNPQTNPLGSTIGKYRVLRPGGWNSDKHDCRSAVRSGNEPHSRRFDTGFRIVSDKL